MQVAIENAVLPLEDQPCDLRIVITIKGAGQPVIGTAPVLHIEVDLQGSKPDLKAWFWRDQECVSIGLKANAFQEGISSKSFDLPCPELTIYIEPTAFFDQPSVVWPKMPKKKGDVLRLAPMGWVEGRWYDGAFVYWQDGQLLSYFPAGYFKRAGISLIKEPREGIDPESFADLYRDSVPTLRQSLLRSISLKYPTQEGLVLCPKSLVTRAVLAMVLTTMSLIDLPRSAYLDPNLDKEERSKLRKLLLNMGYNLLDQTPLQDSTFDLTWVASLLREEWLPGLFAEIHRPTGLLHGFID